jgi:AcrR family transcriptional regulator
MAAGREPAAEDLTARARIRDAALEQFAAHGMRGTTIRGVAEAAGVSPGLVQHHFGSKQKLREACDEYILSTLREVKKEALEGGMGDPGFLSIALRTGLPMQRYLARALVDGSPTAAKLFDDAVELTKNMLEPPLHGLQKPKTADLHAYSAVMTAFTFGAIVLHEHLSRTLGRNTLTPEGYPRLARAMVEVLTDDLMSPELIEQSMQAIRQLPGAPPGPSANGDEGTDADGGGDA